MNCCILSIVGELCEVQNQPESPMLRYDRIKLIVEIQNDSSHNTPYKQQLTTNLLPYKLDTNLSNRLFL